MKWGKILGTTATVVGAIVGGPVGTAVAVGAGAITGGSVGKDHGKKQPTRVQNVLAPIAATVVPVGLAVTHGVDLVPLVNVMARGMEVLFGCTVQCPADLSTVQGAAVASLLGLLVSALHQGGKNVQKARLPQKG